MQQNVITMIAEIEDGRKAGLEKLLREEIDPGFDPVDKTARCRQKMRFDKIRNLHFASFVILHEEHGMDQGPWSKGSEKLKPCLLFEATVDGEIEDFLDTLLLVAGPGIDEVLGHCKGYPESGSKSPHLVKQYLLDHDVGYNTFYSGHPGKSVAQIVEENKLRQKIAKLQTLMRNQPGSVAQSYKGVQRQARRYAVRGGLMKGEPAVGGHFRWAEETPTVPFEVRRGRNLIKALGVAIFVFWAFALLRISGYDWQLLTECYRDIDLSTHLCATASSATHMSDWPLSEALSRGINVVATAPIRLFTLLFGTAWSPTVLMHLLAPFAVWIAARTALYGLSHRERAGNLGFTWFVLGTTRHIASGLRWIALATMATVGVILLPVLQPSDLGPFAPQSVVALVTIGLAVVLGACLILLLARSRPAARPGAAHDPLPKRLRRQFRTALINLTMAPVIYAALLFTKWILLFVLESLQTPASNVLEPLGQLVTVIAAFMLALAAALLIIVAALFFFAQAVLWWQFLVCEWLIDRGIRRYKSADVYTERPIGNAQFQREGNGINTYQNHLISISRIKGGALRRFSLRIVLFVINQICRWWYNRGDLGGIPNIHFLRWVIIDKGRRLLFVDSYSGSWDGYLDAFIDGGACKGMNAIWSHTYLHFESDWGDVSYPQTAFLMWKGARNERPFKEIVRRSQPETLAWYSAYPTLDTDNIHRTSELRTAMFQTLETHQLDKFIQRIIK